MVDFKPDMPEADYRAFPLPSWSSVKGLLDTCPAQWLHDQDAPRTESAAMIWGTLLHAAVLEPHRLAEMVCEPVTVERDDSGKAWTHSAADGATWRTQREAQAAAAEAMPADRYPVTPELMDDLSARAAQAAALLPDDAQREIAMRGVIEGQECKGKADVIGARVGAPGALLDVKTTNDVTPRAVQRAATDRHWFGQLWTYRAIAGLPEADLGVLLIQAPHLTHAGGVLGLADRYQPRAHARVVWLDEAAIEHGRREAVQAWRTYRDCSMTEHWPDWPDETLTPARWATAEEPEAEQW